MSRKYLLVEQYHVTMRVPDDLSDTDAEAVRDLLVSRRFIARLREAVAVVVAEQTPLIVVRLSSSR
ncbi:hypothetical protein [Zavarzinella formosa]|uniref:hypothetical protein n=1 Tax=Zavarzinella formosa TaxID=360055 RepID=UPI0003025278|nr:hypothetical protein [Zavarzinella formosa]